MKHTLLVSVVTLCELFTFIDATDYRSKRSPEFFDVVNSPITYFQDNRTYNREVREHGLPPTSKAQIRRSLARLNIVYSQISDSQKTKGQRYIHKNSTHTYIYLLPPHNSLTSLNNECFMPFFNIFFYISVTSTSATSDRGTYFSPTG